MALKDEIVAYIRENGSKTDVELGAKFKATKPPSIRRGRNELVKEGRLERDGDEIPQRWKTSTHALSTIVTSKVTTTKVPASKTAKVVKDEGEDKAAKADDGKPADMKDWRMTDFTF